MLCQQQTNFAEQIQKLVLHILEGVKEGGCTIWPNDLAKDMPILLLLYLRSKNAKNNGQMAKSFYIWQSVSNNAKWKSWLWLCYYLYVSLRTCKFTMVIVWHFYSKFWNIRTIIFRVESRCKILSEKISGLLYCLIQIKNLKYYNKGSLEFKDFYCLQDSKIAKKKPWKTRGNYWLF